MEDLIEHFKHYCCYVSVVEEPEYGVSVIVIKVYLTFTLNKSLWAVVTTYLISQVFYPILYTGNKWFDR